MKLSFNCSALQTPSRLYGGRQTSDSNCLHERLGPVSKLLHDELNPAIEHFNRHFEAVDGEWCFEGEAFQSQYFSFKSKDFFFCQDR